MKRNTFISLCTFFLFIQGISAQMIVETELNACEASYRSCLDPLNATAGNVTAEFNTCSSAFEACLAANAYVPPVKSLNCFRAEAAWEAVNYQLMAAVTIFAATFMGIPAFMKAVAKLINFAAHIKENGQMRCGCFAKFLLFFTDLNEDGKVEPSELLQPTLTFLGGFSFTAFFSENVKAIKTQADCDFDKAKVPGA